MIDICELFDSFRMWLSDIFFDISVFIMPMKPYSAYSYNHYEDYIAKISGM